MFQACVSLPFSPVGFLKVHFPLERSYSLLDVIPTLPLGWRTCHIMLSSGARRDWGTRRRRAGKQPGARRALTQQQMLFSELQFLFTTRLLFSRLFGIFNHIKAGFSGANPPFGSHPWGSGLLMDLRSDWGFQLPAEARSWCQSCIMACNYLTEVDRST